MATKYNDQYLLQMIKIMLLIFCSGGVQTTIYS